MRKPLLLAAILGSALPGVVLAEEAATPAAAPAAAPEKAGVPTLAQVLGVSGIDLSGYIDVSYNNLGGNGTFINGVNDRVFDFEPDSFNIQQVALTVAKLPAEGFGGLVNLTVGKDADVIAAFDTGNKDNFDITQAYLAYAKGPFRVIAGKYVTLAGAEVINSTSNTNFSRSILFGYAIPFTHTGVRGYYTVNDKLTLMAGVNNGWDDVKDTNGSKTIELGVSYSPFKALGIAIQGYSGNERVRGLTTIGPDGRRDLIDIVATLSATDKLTLVLNYDYGAQDNAPLLNGSTGRAKWYGLAAYANYQINDQWRVSLRGEYFDDKDGYRTAVGAGETRGQKWKEGTLTVAYLPDKSIELRAEVRGDRSDQDVFLDGASAKDTEHSFGLEAIYKF